MQKELGSIIGAWILALLDGPLENGNLRRNTWGRMSKLRSTSSMMLATNLTLDCQVSRSGTFGMSWQVLRRMLALELTSRCCAIGPCCQMKRLRAHCLSYELCSKVSALSRPYLLLFALWVSKVVVRDLSVLQPCFTHWP